MYESSTPDTEVLIVGAGPDRFGVGSIAHPTKQSFSEAVHEHPRNHFQYQRFGNTDNSADFTYKITPSMISIFDTALGKCSVTGDVEAILRKIEYWH
jgi:hypothetical protein